MQILVTGASGFVGQALMAYLLAHGHTVTPVARPTPSQALALGRYDCLIHLAARAHVLHETAADAYQAFKQANVDYALEIARLARQLEIPKFVFLSSVGVHGNQSTHPFSEQDTPQPHNDYAQTKWQAEQALQAFFRDAATTLTIIRPPLVYGPHPKANFKHLLSLCRYPLPLPFGAIDNQRSLVGIDNLCAFILECCQHPAAADQTFLISDGHDVSTPELISTIRKHMHRSACLIPVPKPVLNMMFTCIGRQGLNSQLVGNLQVDISKAKQLLNWNPTLSFDEGIKRAVNNHVN